MLQNRHVGEMTFENNDNLSTENFEIGGELAEKNQESEGDGEGEVTLRSLCAQTLEKISIFVLRTR